jgi:predicted ATP-dependent endonuclease of OLD family
MVRMDKLSELQDNLVAQFSKRISERPDEISNQELMNALKIVQDILERGQKQIAGTQEQPLIQINQQTNSVNVGDEAVTLSRESKQRVANVVSDLLKGLGTSDKVVEATPIENKEED